MTTRFAVALGLAVGLAAAANLVVIGVPPGGAGVGASYHAGRGVPAVVTRRLDRHPAVLRAAHPSGVTAPR